MLTDDRRTEDTPERSAGSWVRLIRKLLVRDSSGGRQEDRRTSIDFDSKVAELGEGFGAVPGGGPKTGDRWGDGGSSNCRVSVHTEGGHGGDGQGCERA